MKTQFFAQNVFYKGMKIVHTEKLVMKTTKTGNSILQNIMEIIAAWEAENIQAFKNFSRRSNKNSIPRYFRLLKKLFEETQSGVAADQLDQKGIKTWAEKDKKITTSLNDLAQELYKKVLQFLAEQFKAKKEASWRIEIEKGLYEVQALMEGEHYSQAAAHLVFLQKKIPQSYSHMIWDDISMFTKMSMLTTGILRHTEILERAEWDRFSEILFSLTQGIHHRWDEFGEFEKQRLKNSQVKLLLYLIHTAEEKKEYENLKAYLDKLQITRNQINKGLHQEDKQSGFHKPVLTKISQAEEVFWQLQKYLVSIKYGRLEDIQGQLRRFKSWEFEGFKTNIGIVAWLLVRMESLKYATLLNPQLFSTIEEKDLLQESRPLIENAYEEIKDLPIRIEMNQIIHLCAIGDWNKAEPQILKVRQIKSIRSELRNQFKILEVWVKMQEKDKLSTELANGLYHQIRKGSSLEFEKTLTLFFKKIAGYSNNFEAFKKRIISENEKIITTLKSLQDPNDPVHQLMMRWIHILEQG